MTGPTHHDVRRPPAEQQARLAELVLYIAGRSEDDPFFGAIKLNKLLFFCDFAAYEKLGSSITGATYRKLEHGPAPRDLLVVRERLIAGGRAIEKRARVLAHEQKRLLAIDEPELGHFTAHEIALVEEVLTELRRMNAAEVSAKSHLLRGWELAADGEEIPYYTVFLADAQPVLSHEEAEFAARLAGGSV